jgi:hypothetical protein
MLEDLPTLWSPIASSAIIDSIRCLQTLAPARSPGDGSGNEYTLSAGKKVYEADDHFFTRHA